MFEDGEWHRVTGASVAEIARLKAVAPVALPDAYYSLLSFSNGGEGPLPIQRLWFCLYPADEVIEIEHAGTFRKFFPNLFVIGGNGGGEAFAFDIGSPEPYPLVAFDMTNSNSSESIQRIAKSFEAALELIGRGEL